MYAPYTCINLLNDKLVGEGNAVVKWNLIRILYAYKDCTEFDIAYSAH